MTLGSEWPTWAQEKPDDDWHEAWSWSESFDNHSKEYLNAAQKAVGVKL